MKSEAIMSESDENKTIRKLFTVITSPVWVPVAAASSLVAAPFQAVNDSVNVANKTNSPGAGVASLPGTTVVRVVTNPFKAVAKVGESMWGKD